jgi:hypothetical protein
MVGKPTPRQAPLAPPGQAAALVYGDGSAGALVVTGTQRLVAVNTQFTDVTVAPGAVLEVEDGTVLRCTGQVLVSGRIVVLRRAQAAPIAPGQVPDRVEIRGLTLREPRIGLRVEATRDDGAEGGPGGEGFGEAGARTLLRPGPRVSGCGTALSHAAGGPGGGTLVIRAEGAVSVPAGGTIDARGGDSSVGGLGGGGGGVLVLASRTSIQVAAPLDASGGRGGSASREGGAGGGGGGGVVHLLAPTLQIVAGPPRAAGGAGGNPGSEDARRTNTQQGGAGGGASAGNGGRGGPSATLRSPAPSGFPGEPGVVLQTLCDPTALFV